MSKLLRILIVEDSEDDALLVVEEFKRAGYDVSFERVQAEATMDAALSEKEWDVIISDYAMPNFSGLAALRLLQKKSIDLPFIIVSGTIGEDVAVEAMKAGAHDYLMKNNLKRLVVSVEREMREAENRCERRKVEKEIILAAEEWERTFYSITDLIFVQDKDMNIIRVNKACSEVLKMDPKDIIGKKCYDLLHNLDHPWPGCPFEKTKQLGVSYTEEVNDPHIGIPLLVTVSPIFGDGGDFLGAVHIAKDIAERKKIEEEMQKRLRELEIFYKSAMGREERIVELKKEVSDLKKDPGK